MKRKRKCVRFHVLPENGRFQVVFLDLTGIVPPWTVGLDYDPPPFLGPFLLDIDRNRIVHFEVVERNIDHFKQGEAVGSETEFEHDCVYGDLYMSQYTRVCEYTASHHAGWFGPTDFTVVANRILSYDDDRKPVEFLRTYKFGSDEEINPTMTPVLLYDSKLAYRWFDQAILRRFATIDNNVWVDFAWDPLSGASENSNRVGFYEFESLEIGYDLVGPYAKVPCYIEARDPNKNRLWRYELYGNARILPVTGIQRIDDVDGTIRDARVSAVVEEVKSALQKQSAIVDEEAEFSSVLSAIDGLKACDINGLAFIKDLTELKNFVEPIVKIIQKPLVLKNWTSLALWWKYGVRLSWQDSKEILHVLTSIKKACKSWQDYIRFKNSMLTRYGTVNTPVPSSAPYPGTARHNSRITVRPKVEKDNNAFSVIGSLLEDLDVKLSAEHLWDLVPYSFVVDWFVDIGGLLKRLDYLTQIDTFQLRERLYSRHLKCVPPDDAFLGYSFSGRITLATYRRYINMEFPFPPLGLAPVDTYRRHTMEGALLVLNASKK